MAIFFRSLGNKLELDAMFWARSLPKLAKMFSYKISGLFGRRFKLQQLCDLLECEIFFIYFTTEGFDSVIYLYPFSNDIPLPFSYSRFNFFNEIIGIVSILRICHFSNLIVKIIS